MLKNSVIIISFILALSNPNLIAQGELENVENINSTKEINNVIQTTEDIDIVPEDALKENNLPDNAIGTVEKSPYKQPTNKKQLGLRFIKAMLGVIIASVTIFGILTIYNNLRKNFIKEVKIEPDEPSLDEPKDISSALRSFVDKTKWD